MTFEVLVVVMVHDQPSRIPNHILINDLRANLGKWTNFLQSRVSPFLNAFHSAQKLWNIVFVNPSFTLYSYSDFSLFLSNILFIIIALIFHI